MPRDFTLFNGATEVIPGSHKFDHKPTQAHHDIDATPVTAPKGSIIFTHGNLWHRAGANKTRQPRVALLCSFAASFMKEIASEEDQSLVIGEDVKQGASDQLRAILGVGHGIKEGAFVQHERLQLPQVAIIIPAFNAEVDKTLCFSRFTKHSATEVIVINDGSTDATGEILEELKIHHGNLMFFITT